jgi:hypothetical protein
VGKLSITLGPEDAPFACDDCDGATWVARGGVREDGVDRAVYLVSRTEGHRPIGLAISYGRFGQGASPDDRFVVSMLARVGEDESFECMVVDPALLPFDCDEVLGTQLDRTDALSHPDLRQVFAVGEFVVNEDPRANAWLAATVAH